MDTLIVEGTPPALEPPGAATQFPTSIDVSRERARVQEVAEVLRRAAGVQVRDFGGLGAFSTLSIRGSNANQIRILVDGVPLDDPLTGALNVNDIRLDGLEEIQVFRGFTPTRLGSPTLGGAVNFVTRPVVGTRRELVLSYGSFDTFRGSAFGSHQSGPHGFAASFNAFSTRGDFTFLDDNGTPLNPDDDEIVRRRNNDRLALGGLLKYRGHPIGRPEVTGSIDLSYKDEGVPGIGNFQSRHARFEKARVLSQIGLSGYGLTWPDVETSLGLFHVFQQASFRDPEGEIGVGIQDTRDRTHELGVNGFAALYGIPQSISTVTARLTGERFSPHDEVGLEEAPDADRGTIEGAFEEEYELPARWITLLGSVSVQHAETRLRGGAADDRSDTLASPRLGVRWDALPGLSLRANAGRFYRIPTFLELFGNTGTVLGNPDLEPESGWSVDLGARYQILPLWLVEVTGFLRDTKDLIVFEQNSQRTSIARNVSQARALGVELSASGRVLWLDLQGNFTLQDIEDRSRIPFLRGNDLPGRPRQQGFGRASLAPFPVEPFFEIDFTGENFLDRANLVQAPDRTILNAGAGFDFGGSVVWLAGLEALVEVKNLTDNRILDVAGFPLPGRSYFGSINYAF